MKSFQRKFSCFLVVLMLFQCFGSGIVFATGTEEGTQALNVQMYNGNRTEKFNSIFPWFKLKNTGTKPINLKDVKLRYYYTIDGDKLQNFWCDYSTIGATNVKGTFVKMPTPSTKSDYYLEIGFKDTAGTLAVGSEIQVQSRFAKNDWSDFDQTNDYSFNPTAKDYAVSNKIDVYFNGNIINTDNSGNTDKTSNLVAPSVKYHDAYLGIILDWSDNEDPNSDQTFNLKRKIDSGEYSNIAEKIYDCDYIDNNVEVNQTYTYIVTVFDKSCQSKDSKEIVVKHVIIDTDEDGLPDDFEKIIGTDKTKADTDGNGIIDSKEDIDKDGLTNEEEMKLGTDPLSKDSDGDELLDGSQKFQQAVSQDINPSKDNAVNIVKNVTILTACTGDASSTTKIKSVYGQDSMASNVVGRMGYPINLETSSKFDKATVKFQYDDIKNIFEIDDLDQNTVCAKFAQTVDDGNSVY